MFVHPGGGPAGRSEVISGLDGEAKTTVRCCLLAALLATSALLVLPPPHVAAASLPVVGTGGTSAGSASWLRVLEGTVVPGDFKLTECRFDYGPTATYGASMPCDKSVTEIGKGTTPVQVSAETEPLDPNTTYHYRLVATNGIGTVEGEDRTFKTGASVPEGGCPNEKIREEQGIAALLLPDCMALEMVSPAEKKGQPARRPNVSADGSRVSFVSGAALGEDPTGLTHLVGATYVASRGETGWSSESTIPAENLHRLWESANQMRPSFTPDFSRWLGLGATSLQFEEGVSRVYEAGLGGLFAPLSGPLTPLSFSSSFKAEEVVTFTDFRGASADHTHLYFQPGASAVYLPDDPNPIGPGAESRNTYLASRDPGGELSLELLQRDGEEKVWGGRCGARLGGIGSVASGAPAPNGMRNQGAIYADGARTFFSARAAQPEEGACSSESKLRILERLETPSGPTIAPLFASECNRPVSEPCSEADGDDLFQGASLDQTKVYFTTNRQLADSDLDGSGEECDVLEAIAGCDLYLYDATRPPGNRLIQVSAGEDVAGHETGKEAKVYDGITAISADGSHAYFVAEGVLTDDENPEGAEAQSGEPNLYLWDADSEALSFLAALAAPLGPDKGDAIVFDNSGRGLWGGQGTWRNNAYPVPVLSPAEQDGERGTEGGNGHILVFESKAELLAEDGDGRRLDVYRYDSAADPETLECLSCTPGSSGADPDEGPFDVDDEGSGGAPGRGDTGPLGTDFAESRRWVSEDGETVGFMTSEPLVPGDLNGAKDSYLWRGGELTRLPGLPPQAVGVEGLPGPYLSHDGSTVAFATFTPLLPLDGDLVPDVYVARAGGGFPPSPPPNICQGEECRDDPTAAPQLSGAGTAVFESPVRPKPCPKGKVRRHGRCVKKRHHKKRHHKRQAGNERRAGR